MVYVWGCSHLFKSLFELWAKQRPTGSACGGRVCVITLKNTVYIWRCISVPRMIYHVNACSLRVIVSCFAAIPSLTLYKEGRGPKTVGVCGRHERRSSVGMRPVCVWNTRETKLCRDYPYVCGRHERQSSIWDEAQGYEVNYTRLRRHYPIEWTRGEHQCWPWICTDVICHDTSKRIMMR